MTVRGESAGPLSGADRIETLDVLRGFALYGILIMNIQAFAMVATAYINPNVQGPPTGADLLVWLIGQVFVAEKFITIFTLLFGAGIVLMTSRADATGTSGIGRHLKRMGWLALIGLTHAYLIWYGDILFAYAVSGLIVVWARDWPVRRLLGVALLLFAVPSVIGIVMTLGLAELLPEQLREVEREAWRPDPTRIAAEIAAYRGGWMSQMAARVPEALSGHTWVLPTEKLWRTIALMLGGMAAFKSGLITGDWSDRAYWRVAALGFLVGLPIVVFGIYMNYAMSWQITFSLYIGRMFNNWASPLVALGWIAVAILFVRHGSTWFARVTIPVGRTALSNYLLQSIICTFVFYGHGFGLFSRLGRTEQLAVVFIVWVIMPVWSSLWLNRFRFGPAEWLWRSLTYGRLQPIKRQSVAV